MALARGCLLLFSAALACGGSGEATDAGAIDAGELTGRQLRDTWLAAVEEAGLQCDGVEPDNVDGYTNAPGFPLTAADQLDYNRFLAAEAHARGLSIGLKNDLDQVPALVDDFDWALNEQCFEYGECDALQPFIDAGKAVFTVEYGEDSLADEICPMANSLDLDTLIKPYHLGPERLACR